MPISKENKEKAIAFCGMMDKLMKCYYENNTIEEFEKMEEMLHQGREIGQKYDEELDEDVPVIEPSVYDFYRKQADMDVMSGIKKKEILCVRCDCFITKKGMKEHQMTAKCRHAYETKKLQHASTNLKTADKYTEADKKWDGNKLTIEAVNYNIKMDTYRLRNIIQVMRKQGRFVVIDGKKTFKVREIPPYEREHIRAKNLKKFVLDATKKMKKFIKDMEKEKADEIRAEKKRVAQFNKEERERKSREFQERKRLKALEKANK